MMMFDNNKLNTMDFQKMMSPNPLAMNENITGKSRGMCSQSINANNDQDRRSSDNSNASEDSNSMFTKFAFPFKLHSILESSESSGQGSIISWLPSGKAFKIHKPKEFADVIMPQYFNQTKYRSFQRQLYIYGFDRIKDKKSDDYGAYFHELFIRGASDLCLDMQRKKIKGTGLSNEERRKKASMLRANAKPSSNKRPSKTQQDNSQMTMHSDPQITSSQPIYASRMGLNSLSPQAQQQQQSTRKVNSSKEWNSSNTVAVLKSALQAQQIASCRGTLNTVQNNINNNGSNAGRIVSFDKILKSGRRCSLGFVRGTRMGRRGSLLFDGDEVCFGDRKFFFTTEY